MPLLCILNSQFRWVKAMASACVRSISVQLLEVGVSGGCGAPAPLGEVFVGLRRRVIVW